jgi:heme A synthase
MSGIRMHTSLGQGSISNPIVRVLLAVVGLLIVAGVLALLVFIALPLALLAIGVTLVAGLVTAFFPQLRRRRPRQPMPAPRRSGGMKSVEPDAPPRTLG